MIDTGYGEKLATNLLLEYINKFYGYGSWAKSRFWFIGIEEGGGNELDQVKKRLDSWHNLGETDLVIAWHIIVTWIL